MHKLDQIVSELNVRAVHKEALNYYVRYAGFQNVFRVPFIKPSDNLKYPALTDCLSSARKKDGNGLINQILQSIGGLLRQRTSFDVLLLYLPGNWEDCFE